MHAAGVPGLGQSDQSDVSKMVNSGMSKIVNSGMSKIVNSGDKTKP